MFERKRATFGVTKGIHTEILLVFIVRLFYMSTVEITVLLLLCLNLKLELE
jgi:hypothetical protein